MNKHTPGPWVLRTDEKSEEVIGPYLSNKHICDTTGNFMSREERFANARLIASAPELLELLKEMESVWRDGITCRFEPGCKFSQKVLQAIAKAEGRE